MWFFNPKKVTIGSGVDQNKKSPSFWPIGQKLPFFNGKISLAIRKFKFLCNMSIFWSMGQKDGNFLFWSTPESMVTFLGLKITHLLKKRFLEHPVFSNFQFSQNLSLPVPVEEVQPWQVARKCWHPWSVPTDMSPPELWPPNIRLQVKLVT